MKLAVAFCLPVFLALLDSARGQTKIVLTNDDGWAVANIHAAFSALTAAAFNVSLAKGISWQCEIDANTAYCIRLSCLRPQRMNRALDRRTPRQKLSAQADASLVLAREAHPQQEPMLAIVRSCCT